MADRIWDNFLTEADRAHMGEDPADRKGAGTRPALVLVDLYRWAFGDKPEPLMESVKRWPGSCGLNGWTALPHIQQLLATARARGIPVVYITQFDNLPNWRETRKVAKGAAHDPEMEERRRHRYDLIPEIAPLPGELVVPKTAPSGFWGTPLAGLLVGMGVDTIIVCGETTSGCIRATVVDGKAYRFKVLIAEETVFDRHEAPHAINLFDMNEKYADVIPLQEVLDYLEAVAP